jgi:hypothetical protein
MENPDAVWIYAYTILAYIVQWLVLRMNHPGPYTWPIPTDRCHQREIYVPGGQEGWRQGHCTMAIDLAVAWGACVVETRKQYPSQLD